MAVAGDGSAERDPRQLTAEPRVLPKRAFYAAFRWQLGEDTQWLQQAMAARNVTLDR